MVEVSDKIQETNNKVVYQISNVPSCRDLLDLNNNKVTTKSPMLCEHYFKRADNKETRQATTNSRP